MIGYLHPLISELKIKDYQTYQDYCCGVCSYLRSHYGWVAQALLSHDMVMYALLSDGLAGRVDTVQCHRCVRHCIKKRRMSSQTKGIRLSVDLQVLLAYHRAEQINKREKFLSLREKIRQRLILWLMRGIYHRTTADHPGIARMVQQEKDHAAALELAGCTNYDMASEPYANLFSALFVFCGEDDSVRRALRRMGYHMGRIFFFVDQAEGYEADKICGVPNIFIQNGLSFHDAVESAKHRCNIAAAELAKAYSIMDIKVNRSLLDNIIFLGLETMVSDVGAQKSSNWDFR